MNILPLELAELEITFNGLLELLLVLGGPRWTALQELVDGDSQRPNIAFRRVYFVKQCLRAHVERSSDLVAIFESGGTGFDRKAEVSKFNSIAMHEDVARFDVAMNNVVRMQIFYRTNKF